MNEKLVRSSSPIYCMSGKYQKGEKCTDTDTNVGILDDNICGMKHFSEWQSILTNIGIQANTTGG